MVGQTIAHYDIREKLGEGASSVVYRAEDTALRRDVALKFLAGDLSDAGSIARFQHEARTVSSLNHPNICTIYEIGAHDGRPYLAMELLEGDVLSRLIGGRPIDPYRVVDLAAQVADALEAAHAESIVHRDVKPANIFVTRRNQAKLLDFGLAVLVPHRNAARAVVALSSSIGGTIPYMSPEQVRAEALDHRTDLFSLGVVLYEMATGTRPFVGAGRTEVMDAIVHNTAVPVRTLNPAILPELERIIDKALEKTARLRYQTASDLRADLERLKRDLGVPRQTAPPAGSGMPRRRSTTRVAAVAAGVLGVAALTGIAAAAIINYTRPPEPVPVPEPRLETGPQGDVALPADASAPVRVAARPAPRTERPARAETTAAAVEPAAAPLPLPIPAAAAPPPTSAAPSDDLRIARQKIALKLYDQALESLRRAAGQRENVRDAVEASFLIASIHELRGAADDATSTYLELASRHPDDPRAPEALVRMAESTLKSKRRDRDTDARQILTDAVRKYPASPWAARALLMRGDLESRLNLYQLDTELGTSAPMALASYREVIDHYSSSSVAPAAMHESAEIYVQMKRYEAAARLLETLAARDTENRYDAWFAAAEVYERRLKDPARARAAYSRVPHSSTHFADAQKRLRK